MKNLTKLGLLCCCLFLGVSALASIKPAQQAVQEATDQLLARLVQIQPLYVGDPDQFFAEVDVTLGPFVDFSGFSKGVMAKYYRRATDAQKTRFETVFRRGLVRTYAKALVEFDNQRVEFVDSTAAESEPDRASVDLKIYGQEGAIYAVNYNLVLLGSDWKLRNVTIEGINIGLQFRSQFAAYMDKFGNDIDKVINNWSVDV
ncbi:MAG: ABC transporter substrate-binding protein [SAR86 cluster bacterium]|jgi:phospholipid transport system substrate-binding protein|tara:strand:+ start:29553 stop:30158 length:606 start_codon:yes stop_codon:yes gene_type:complete